MKEHYIDKSKWQDELLEGILTVIAFPIGLTLLLLFGERGNVKVRGLRKKLNKGRKK
jgi:hypothetical protein